MSSSEGIALPLSPQAGPTSAGRLNWIHWLVLSVSLILTFGAWHFAKGQVDGKTAARFEREAARTVELLSERMRKYEDALWGGVGAIEAQGGNIDNEGWRRFASSIQVDVKYPGTNGIGVIYRVPPERKKAFLLDQRRQRPEFRLHPMHSEPEYWPITYIEPVDINRPAVGLDMAHETNRYSAAKKARDTGEAQITGPIVLVQDEQKTAGFLLFVPFYDGGASSSIETRRRDFTGMVYAPFVVKKLMDGALEKRKRDVVFSISDGASVLYDELAATEPGLDPAPLFSTAFDLPLYGRNWRFDLQTTMSFRNEAATAQPTLILLAGLIIDGLLLWLFLSFSRTNRKAIAYADEVTNELKHRTARLERSNADLEQFAYVASHDLRAPLRAIDNLAHWIAEDLKDTLTGEPKENLLMLRSRAKRLERLLDDLLQYSRAGRGSADYEIVDTRSLVEDVVSVLSPPDNIRVTISSELPRIEAAEAALEQILRNLIGNAIKHSYPDRITMITVSCELDADYTTFMVADDGVGIAPRYHERVFGMFQTLQSRDDVEGSGMGLAIVKRLVEAHGGTIGLESPVGADTSGDADQEQTLHGTLFRFTWPRNRPKDADHAA